MFATTVKIDGIEYNAQAIAGRGPAPHHTAFVEDVLILDANGKLAERLMRHLSDDEWLDVFQQVERALAKHWSPLEANSACPRQFYFPNDGDYNV